MNYAKVKNTRYSGTLGIFRKLLRISNSNFNSNFKSESIIVH